MKVYIGKTLAGVPVVDLIRPNLGESGLDRWTERYVQLDKPIVEIVDDTTVADALLFPHNWNSIRGNTEYVSDFVSLSKKLGKKIIIFFPGDSDADVPIENAVVFRNSQYRSKLKSNEIILPGYVADLGLGLDLKPRLKGSRALVGFCGWGDWNTFGQRVKSLLKSFSVSPVYRQGMWWRRRALQILARSKLVDTKFIIRRSYSGNEKTIEVDPERARQEYVDNILGSDFTLCVKGDGNFSTRFYETLSLGRIPLLLDTECVLPLEDKIDYGEIILRVDYNDIGRIDQIVADFYTRVPDSQFMEMQIKTREVFVKYLRLDAYFREVLTKMV